MSKKKFGYWWLIIILVSILVVGSGLGYLVVKYLDIVSLPFGEKSIAIVEVNGAIYSSKDVLKQLQNFQENSNVGGIIIKVDSPGGAIVPTDEIYEKIKEIKEEKEIPVYCSMGNLAASGGYYIASICDKIYANKGTITGSISVIMTFPNIEELFTKIGVEMVVVKTGEYKDLGSMYRDMTEEEKTLLQGVIDDMYEQFIDVIYEGRGDKFVGVVGSDKKEDILAYIEKHADGRIFTGRQAEKMGFVDEIGTIDDCIDALGEEMGIEGEPKILKIKKKKKGLFSFVVGERFERVFQQNPTIEYRFK